MVPAGLADAGGSPGGLTAFAADGAISLAWQTVPAATAYEVYRGPSPSDVTNLVASPVGASYVDGTAVDGTTYYYAVRAVVGGVESAPSNLVAATPLARSCSGGNPIVLENCYPGTSNWKTQAATDAEHGGIEGFATATSINAGDTVDLKVSTAAGAPYRIEIYRTGYYGGAQARLISVVPGLRGIAQPSCLTDATTGLVDCSNWSVTSTLTTTADWPTGVFVLRLVREDNGTDNHVLLVVRHDGGAAALAYQVPVATYQAYNNYGGRSLYDFNSFGSTTISGTPRAVEVSYDRPYQEPVNGLRNWYSFSDIEAVSWLERNGYDVGYVTSLDLQERGSQLSAARAFISGAHDEYWSSTMRGAITAARDAGTSLFFLGGNSVYWKIRYEASPYTGVADRVEVCYKTTQGGPPDPTGDPTGTWRDPGGANAPENGLIGVMYVGDNDSVFYPLVVTAAEAQNRVWRYTTLATMAPGATASVGQSLVGWEWDARFANGYEPSGVTPVASSPVAGELLTDAGATYATGSTTATTAVYRAASGSWVFATGTNQWSRGLGLDMTGVGEPNVFIQQATANVLADMGARPSTPQSGLTVDALGSPNVLRTSPAAGASGVADFAPVTATFDKPLDPTTVTTGTFTLAGPGGSVAASVSYDSTSGAATLTPSQPLGGGATYTATLTTGIRTWGGTPLPASVSWTFTTASLSDCPCSLFPSTLAPSSTHLSVVDGRSGSGPFSYELGVKMKVAVTSPLSAIRFYKDSLETGVHVGRVWTASGTQLAQVTFSNETASGWQQQALTTPLTLQPGVTYVVSVNANAYFGDTASGLQSQVANGVLASVADGSNGVFGSAAGVFPTQSFNSSNYFVDVGVGLPPADTAPPTAPSQVTATASSPSSVNVAWVASTDNVGVTGYNVYRNGVLVGGVSGATTSYVDKTVQPATTYSYTVSASDAAGNVSALGGPATVTTPADTTPPTTPTGLAATVRTGEVDLAWTASTDNVAVTGYAVFRNTVKIATVATATFADKTVTQGTSYAYVVKAVDAAGNVSAASNQVTVVPDWTAPTAPSSLKVANISGTQVGIAWKAATDNVAVAGYHIFRNGVRLADTTSTSYADKQVVAGSSYTYTVQAFDAAGNVSAQSNSVTATVPDTAAPTAPSGLAATVLTGEIDLAWTASTDNVGVAGYSVYRNNTKIATTATTTFADKTVVRGTTYTYTVKAFDAAGNLSAASNPVKVKAN